jgi:hypothetical protein
LKLLLKNKSFQVLLFAFIVLLFYYHKLVLNLGEIVFNTSGDGFSSYFNTLYHILHDKQFFHTYSMNYPYGENSFFTGNFFFLTSIINYNPFITDKIYWTLFLLNGFMLFAIPVSALFIFKVFAQFNQTTFFHQLISLGIAFLSPQVHRLGGHYALSISFLIPVLLYLIIRFYRNPTYINSLYIFIYVLFMSLISFYFFALLGLILGCFYLIYLIFQFKNINLKVVIPYFFIQLVLPFIIIQLLSKLSDNFINRTNTPWGFFHYFSKWEGVFLPINKPLGFYINKLIQIEHVEWEGIAYVGTTISILTILLIFISPFYFKRILYFVRINFWSQLFILASIISLLISFCYPFIIPGFEGLVDYLSVLKQLRAIGRFNWIFYYLANIGGITIIYLFLKNKNKYFKNITLTFFVMVVFYDAHTHNCFMQDQLNNKPVELLRDSDHKQSNSWLNKLNWNKDNYQAIIPLSYVHIGSESIWIDPSSDVLYYSYIASLKTGLPLYSVQMSRTSITQTYKNIALVFPPYRNLEILEEFNNHKDILLIVDIWDKNSLTYKHLYENAEPLFTYGKLAFYSLKFSTIQNLYQKEYFKIKEEMENIDLFSVDDGFLVSDTSSYFELKYFNQQFEKSKSFLVEYKDLKQVDLFKNNTRQGANYQLSFWVNNINKDLVPRTIFNLVLLNQNNEIIHQFSNNIMFRCIRQVDEDLALIELDFEGFFQNETDKLALQIIDKPNINYMMSFNNYLIKEKDLLLFKKLENGCIYKNNRFYLPKK